MLLEAKRKKRRIDVACGYTALAYASATLFWLLILAMQQSLGLLLIIMSATAALAGILRAWNLGVKFWIVPAITLSYLTLVIISQSTTQPLATANLVIMLSGMAYSIVCLIPTVRLWRDEFGKHLPAWLCKNCGYSLFGLSRPTCPECGQVFDPSKVPEMSSATNQNKST